MKNDRAQLATTVMAVFAGFGVASYLFLLNGQRFTAASPASPAPTEVTSLPPEQFTGGGQIAVRFVPPYMIVDECGLDAIACTQRDKNRIVIVNPCVYNATNPILQYRQRPGRAPLEVHIYQNEFTRELCHELGHVNGWDHGDGPVTALYPGQPR